jgi:hypothetical protein
MNKKKNMRNKSKRLLDGKPEERSLTTKTKTYMGG